MAIYEQSSPYLYDIETQFGDSEFAPKYWLGELDRLSVDQEEVDFTKALYDIKAQFDLSWAGARFHDDPQGFIALGRTRSEFAALSIEKALQFAWAQTQKDNRLTPVPLKGLFILGLGKLGGFDLNFSSDVDIIAYFDADIFPVPDNKGKKYIANKVLQYLTRLLHPKSGRFMWRVDWRLRPEASASGLAMTTMAALNFYHFRALPWHRLAMIKARVVAGDQEVGQDFLNQLRSFLWRRNLDFKAIEEIAHLKRRINLEHPSLQIERSRPEPIMPDPIGFNVKLGRGGIREIEFIANALQLIWGGKKYNLRVPHSLTVLKNLGELGLIDKDELSVLMRAYKVFRRLEDAIQMQENAQIHSVPDGEALERITALMGVEWESYKAELYDLRLRVNAQFETFFAEEDDAATPEFDSVPELSRLESTSAKEIAQSWLNGFDQHGLRPEDFSRFQKAGRDCLDYVLTQTETPDEALKRVDSFLRRISRSGQYFRILERNPKVFRALIDPLLYSSHMSVLLQQSPHIIDCFLDPSSAVHRGEDYQLDPSFILSSQDYGLRLELLRRFVNEHLFAYYHLFTQGEGDRLLRTPQFQAALTELAAVTIKTAIDIVKDHLGLDHVPMAVLGFGKMGTGHMAPQSDLDLVIIFDDAMDSQLCNKIVARLTTVLTTPLAEGIAYELDMRLRPSGRSGPAAVKLASFIAYQNERAKTWEHIALSSARCVAGDEALCVRVEAEIAKIISRPRDHAQCLSDAKLMWSRIAGQRLADTQADVLNSKLAEGGLMQAEYTQSVRKLIGQPDKELEPAITFWRRAQIWERLFDLTGKTLLDMPLRYKERLTRSDIGQFLTDTARHRADVIAAMEDLFQGVEFDPNDREAPILWED